MGNNAGKEGDRSRGAVSNKKSSAGGMFRQGSMHGEQGNKGAQKGTNTTSSWGSSLKRVVAGVGTQIVISEKSSEGSWPPFAVSSVQGMRKGMEDEFYAGGEHTFSEESSMFGVFDGHGGVECARYIKKHLPALLCERMDKEEPRDALRSAFLATDQNFIQQVTILDADAGSTGVVALIQSGTLYVAHAGDSRAILRRQGEAERLTIDHKPGRVDESERVVRCGGRVVMGRVNGVLAVSRAFGNKHLKSCVTAEPEILKVDLQVGDDYLILASDGLWDVVSDQVALQLVDSHCKQGNGLKEAAELLTSQAMKLGSRDNITVIVVNVRDWHVERQRSSPPGSPFAMDGLMD